MFGQTTRTTWERRKCGVRAYGITEEKGGTRDSANARGVRCLKRTVPMNGYGAENILRLGSHPTFLDLVTAGMAEYFGYSTDGSDTVSPPIGME